MSKEQRSDGSFPVLFAGVSGVELESLVKYELGHGIFLGPTYAHIFASFMMAFAPPSKKGEAHPGPWKPASGGLAYDIKVELAIPTDLECGDKFGHYQALWLFAALLRLKVAPIVTVPVISTVAFSDARTEPPDAHFFSMEVFPGLVSKSNDSVIYATASDIAWLQKHWPIAKNLMESSHGFARAFKSYDGAHFSRVAADAIIILWGALEQLFSKKDQELSFRASATIAAYLEPPGEERENLFKKIRKLYEQRSKVAHGTELKEQDACVDTFELVGRCLIAMIENSKVPNVSDLERNIFDNHLWG